MTCTRVHQRFTDNLLPPLFLRQPTVLPIPQLDLNSETTHISEAPALKS